MAVGRTPLPSGSALHFGNLIHRKNLAAKTRRGVLLCAPSSTRDVQVVYDLLLSQRRSRAAAKNNESNTNTVTGAGEPKKEDYETLGHLTQAALTGCPLMIVGTTAPTFIHFSTVDAILDERESGSACNFVIVTMDKEHRFAADMSTDYTEWIYALRDAMTIGNRHSFRGTSRDDDSESNADDEDAPLDDPAPPASSSMFKRAKSLGRSPSAVNLNITKRFGFPTRSHTYDAHSAAAPAPAAAAAAAATPRAVYDLPSYDNDDNVEEHDSRSGGSPPRETIFVDSSLNTSSSGEIVTVLPVPYVPRPVTTISTTSTTPNSPVRRRSDANVRFADRPAAPPKDSPVAETATAGVQEEEDDEKNVQHGSNDDDDDEHDDDDDDEEPAVAPRAPIGGMVGQVPPQHHRSAKSSSSSDLPITTHPSVNRSLSRKLSTFFGVDPTTTTAAGGPKSPPLDGSTSTSNTAAKSAKSIGRKLTNIFAAAAAAATSSNASEADRRGRGRSAKSAAAEAAAPAAESSSPREPRARSLVRMFSRSSVTEGTTAEGKNVEDDTTTSGERESRRSRSSTRGRARSRSSSRTRLFTLVPSVRYTGSASLGNMFRKHTGDPEIDDDDIVAVVPPSRSRSPAPAVATTPAAEEDEEDEELPRRRRSDRSGPLRTIN
ncbi:hypothetical protein HDU87_001111 [Geranomyces variabilis]|uniref:PH domain-containing protein n=1 Tax=Geranomyces variabilis TaxID=109894 RepID=A0AAD5XSV5_9FUNG|nr:hypothetical protein HDU87_001111 [Geranomyces variabilis]